MKQLIFKKEKWIWTEKLLLISFGIFPFLWGVFYTSTACFAGVLWGVLTIAHIFYTQKLTIRNDITMISFLGILIGYSIAGLFAIDTGMSWLRIGKIAAVVMFYLFVLQIKKEVLEMCIQTIPHTGSIMVLLSSIAYFIPDIDNLFFQARRMGGFFQYSNTFAFFLLIGIVVLLSKDIYKKADIAEVAVLLLGLLWSGSRSVFLLFGIVILTFAFQKSTHRKTILPIGISTVAIVVLYTAITKDVQNIGRILTVSLQSSTLLGRILYSIDAIEMLFAHPMGLGSLGYFYLQQAEQSGVYTTMFVHNDLLQFGLDGGILAMTGFFIWIAGNTCSKYTSKRNCGIFVLFLLHILVDFDLQYTYLFFVLVIIASSSLTQKEKKIAFDRNQLKKWVWIPLLCCAALFYLGSANKAEETGNHVLAVKLYPWNTESMTVLMMEAENLEEVELYADKILKQNPYSYAAYNMKAVTALEQKNYKEMIAYKKKALSITKYDIAEYQDYIVMLKKAIDDSISRNDIEDYQNYVKDLLAVPVQIENVKKNTHWLAWKLRDTPKLTLGQEYVDYIEWYRGIENE